MYRCGNNGRSASCQPTTLQSVASKTRSLCAQTRRPWARSSMITSSCSSTRTSRSGLRDTRCATQCRRARAQCRTGLERGTQKIELQLKAMQLNDDEEPLECTLTHTKIDLEVDLDTQASPQKSRVTYSELSPVLGKTWHVPRPGEAGGRRVVTYRATCTQRRAGMARR